MSATILNFPSSADLLCGGLPVDAVVAADWDGNWGSNPDVEVAQFLVPRPEVTDGIENVFVTVAVEPSRMRVLAAMVTVEEPEWEDITRLLSWLDVPENLLGALVTEQDWPGMASVSTTLMCSKRLGVGCGCEQCQETEASAFACDVAAAALAFVAMHGGPSAQVNRRLATALPRWVEFFTQPLSA